MYKKKNSYMPVCLEIPLIGLPLFISGKPISASFKNSLICIMLHQGPPPEKPTVAMGQTSCACFGMRFTPLRSCKHCG